MKKRLLMMLSILLTAVGGVNSQTPSWTNHAASEFSRVEGDAIYITTAAELALFANNVNGGNSYEGQTFVLDADLDLSKHYWKPIGNPEGSREGTPFRGTFNGNKPANERKSPSSIWGDSEEGSKSLW